MSVGTDGSTSLEEVEVVACGGRAGAGDGGLAVDIANSVWGVIFVTVDVDGTPSTSRRGISFGGYEERS